MIKFFRKIRQKLLSENKFSKYLLYAIGEIILVVIGILIALQINNLNEESKKRKEEISILQNLSLDIDNDLLQHQANIDETLTYSKRLNSLYQSILNKENDSIDKIFPYLFGATNVPFFKVKTSTIDESLSSGKFTYIQNDSLRDNISSYYKWVKTSHRDNDVKTYAIRELRPMLFDAAGVSKKALLRYGIKSNFPEFDANAFINDKRIGKIIIIYNSHSFIQIQGWKNYMRRASILQNKIKKELKLLKN